MTVDAKKLIPILLLALCGAGIHYFSAIPAEWAGAIAAGLIAASGALKSPVAPTEPKS